MVTRRSFLAQGFGSLLVACAPAFARPTPSVDDGDPAPACTPTADNIEGPFYKKGAPSRATLVGDRDAGERLVLTGTVRDTQCRPLANATLDIWHADARGGYDNDGFGMRGKLVTDKHGRWSLKTIIPGRYLNGRRYRPSHIHVKLRAAKHTELTTQLYFEGDPYIEGDDFVVSALIMPHTKDGAIRRAAFDFVLV
jgi:catechol 1,2-dioxygenase